MRLLARDLARWILALGAVFVANLARAETIPLEVHLNHVPKGVYFVYYTDQGSFLLSEQDYAELGLPTFGKRTVEHEGEDYVSLEGQPYLTVSFDDVDLVLEIDVSPAILPMTRIDFANPRERMTRYPLDRSLIVNYGVSHFGTGGQPLGALKLPHEIAARQGRWLFLSSSDAYVGRGDNWVRYLSAFLWQHRDKLLSAFVGDAYTTPGSLSSQVLIGGAGVTKSYDIDPYYVSYPGAQFSGDVLYPTQAEIYVDGALIRRQELPPGPFVMQNLSRFEGAGDVSVVLIDDEGNETLMERSFYQTTTLLKEDLHDFSYNVGFLRQGYGLQDFAYDTPVFSAFHRYGVNDAITVGCAAEGAPHLLQVSPGILFRTGLAGAWELGVAQSVGRATPEVTSPDAERLYVDGYTGTAGVVEYAYRRNFVSTGFRVRAFTEEYATLGTQLDDRPELDAQVRGSVGFGKGGALSLSALRQRTWAGNDEDRLEAFYSLRIRPGLSLSSSLSFSWADEDEVSGQLTMLYYPRSNDVNSTATYRRGSDDQRLSLGARTPRPIGEGVSYGADFDWEQTLGQDSWTLEPEGQWNSPWGAFEGRLGLTLDDNARLVPSYQVEARGAMVWMGPRPHFGRPVDDGFALVKVSDVGGVGVTRNAIDMGQTNRNGVAFIPEMSSNYDNQVGVDDEDVPLEYAMGSVMEYVSPPPHGGACVVFGTVTIQPLVGKFVVRDDGSLRPLEFAPYTVTVGDTVLETQTAFEGEFYIDMTEAGELQTVSLDCSRLGDEAEERRSVQHVVRFELGDGRVATGVITPPATDEFFVELGEVVLTIEEAP